ncbi:VOC family protein [Comamonas sp.]|uniref:VOC family protein n=1 Tax=Comamonas sp. TaxID=34028 RepID=UPI0012CC3D08|nr:VOC family protein [Comamonas sp.]MPS94413.1 VOC family protein [Comamonas sp.]
MRLPLDHIVIAVQDLERTIADYQTLGFNVLRGGEHPGRSTHNALVVFADGVYFELIAWRAPAPEERWWQQLQQHGEGLVDFALLPTETGTAVAEAQARGLSYEAPYEGGRLRPDGAQLRWRNARARSQDLPFLCGDLTPRVLRVPEGQARVHPNGVTGVARLEVAVRDLQASLARWRALLGEGVDVGPLQASADGRSERVSLRLGSTELVLAAPLQAAGELAQRLDTRGEGPYAVVLSVPRQESARKLDEAATHRVRLELARPSGIEAETAAA